MIASTAWLGWAEALPALLAREALLATLLFLAVAPLARLLRGRAPVFIHALWALVLLRLVLPVGWAAPWSARALLGLVPSWSGLPWNELLPGLDTGAAAEVAAAGFHAEGLVTPTGGVSSSPGWAAALAGLWLAGVAINLAIWWRRRRRYARLLAASQAVTDPRAIALLASWRRRLGVRRPVRLLSRAVPVTPFTVGVARPLIFLPKALLLQGDGTMLEAVIAHEVAHVRRLDALWLALQNGVRALYFFHPVAWIASSRLIEARESLCDRLVLSRGALSPRAYGRSLLAVLRFAPRLETRAAPAFGVPAFALPSTPAARRAKRRLALRLTTLLSPTATVRPRSFLPRVAALILALFLLPMAGLAGAGDEVAATPSPELAVGTPIWGTPILALAARTAPAVKPLVHPLADADQVTSAFGQRKNPFTGEMAHHTGIDIQAKIGTVVHAAGAGVVEVATLRYPQKDNWGTVVILDHGDGLKTFYAHLDRLSVEAGQRVAVGDPIGGAGNTGQVTGPHLHFEVWKDGVAVDPADYIADGC